MTVEMPQLLEVVCILSLHWHHMMDSQCERCIDFMAMTAS
jgi:hypothetical protein